MSYKILSSEQAAEFIESLDDKSKRIVRENLEKLEDDPYPRPDSGSGDKEKVTVEGEEVYRLHIGRSLTAFYVVVEEQKQVRVFEILDIDEAHKRYD